MFDFLGRGKNKPDKSSTDDGPPTLQQTVQLSPTQIDVVRMTLLDVLRLHGIPGTWVTSEVIPMHVPGQGEALVLQLEVKHWHDALVLHAPAFQEAMLDGLHRFDPHADQTRYLFTWKFSPDCGCPHTQLPKGDFWRTSERVVLAPIAPPVPTPADAAPPSVAATPAVASPPPAAASKSHVDLPMEDDDDDDNGFAPTQIRDDR